MDPTSSIISITSPTNSTPSAGPSQEATASPRVSQSRMSPSALAAKAYAAKVTSMRTPSDEQSTDDGPSTEEGPSTNDVPKARPLVRPPSRVARARIVFPDAKCTMVREAVMPEGVPEKTYYHLMVKSLANLKEILNKTFNSKINSPSPVVPRKRRSSVAAVSSKAFDKPSKKAKKIIV